MIAKRFIVVALLMSPSVVFAEDEPPQRTGGRMVFEAAEIIGEQQRPEVSLFLSPQDLDQVQDLELDESLLPRIVESVERDPL